MAKRRKMDKAEQVYATFHGVPPTKETKVDIPGWKGPKKLIILGVIDRLDYSIITESERKGHHYTHEMGDIGDKFVDTKVYLCTDEHRHMLYGIPANPQGKYPVITERGIVG
jgi:hypothetical protein